MKKNLLRLAFSLFVFILCLALTEAFFRLNARYDWVRPREYPLASAWTNSRNFPPFPPALAREVMAKAEKFNLPNDDIRDQMDNDRHLKVLQKNPLASRYYIAEFKPGNPGQSFSSTRINTRFDRTVFDITYSFDETGARRVPGQAFEPGRKNLLFIGCSMTFGQGVNDDQSMPYFVKQKLPGYNVYNAGVPGGGMSDMLDDITLHRRPTGLSAKGGAVIYYFIYDHFERTFCSVDCYRADRAGWLDVKNYYSFGADGKLVNNGPHAKAGTWRSFFYPWLAKSEFLSFIGYDRPRRYSAAEQAEYVRYIKELRDYYAEKNLDFYVFGYEFVRDSLAPEFYQELEKAGITYFAYDPKGLPMEAWNKAHIIGDGHASELGNLITAGLVADFLKQHGY